MPKFRISEPYYGNGINVAVGTGCASMTIPLYSGLVCFFPPIGAKKQRHGSAAIIAFVSGCAAAGLYTNNHSVWKHPIQPEIDCVRTELSMTLSIVKAI